MSRTPSGETPLHSPETKAGGLSAAPIESAWGCWDSREFTQQNSRAEITLIREPTAPRQPLFLAAIIFSLGLCAGVRAWRPPAWWMIAILVFALAALWFLSRRAWLAKALALAAWFLLGALLIQVRGRPADDPKLLALSDGRVVTLTAHVIREGYAHAAGPRSIRQSLDVETEEIESEGKAWPVRTGIRLSLYGPAEFPPSVKSVEAGATSGSVAGAVQGMDEAGGQQRSAGHNGGDNRSS